MRDGLPPNQALRLTRTIGSVRGMWRVLGIVGLAILLCVAEDARACSAGIPYDFEGELDHDVGRLSQDEIIAQLPEVVV